MSKKILIEGMSCEHCVKHVEEALKDIGAKHVKVKLKEKVALIEDGIDDSEIKAAIEDAGYDVIKIEKV